MDSMLEQVNGETHASVQERFRVIDGPTLRKATEAALNWLRVNQQIVNALNVFPVPDGDTGTNMVLTMQAAWDEISNGEEISISQVAKDIAHGALMGARGNSGVILSQLWRGFARALDNVETMDAALFAAALDESRATAYKGVVRPVEGTILTVSTDMALAAKEAIDLGMQSTLEVLEYVVKAADASVKRTPTLLPVLADAGVVDSGGKGLYYILEGMLRFAYNLPMDTRIAEVQPLSAINVAEAQDAIEPGQDWEVVVDFRPAGTLDVQSFYNRLETMGTSIQLGEGDGMYRMHIHVPDETEFEPITYIKSLGTITNVAIENLVDQLQARESQGQVDKLILSPVEPGQIAAVAVVPGIGIARVFASLGAAAVIEGGQTMNPSTQEILAAFENLPTDQIIILPNNKNILLAARQTVELTVKSVRVVPSVSVPQGVAGMLCLEPDGDLDQVYEAMTEALEDVQSAAVTTATRSVEIDGVEVKEGQVIGLVDGRLALASESVQDCFMQILDVMDAETHELITLYFGQGLTGREANQLADVARKEYPQQEFEIVEGNQPHYQLIISAE